MKSWGVFLRRLLWKHEFYHSCMCHLQAALAPVQVMLLQVQSCSSISAATGWKFPIIFVSQAAVKWKKNPLISYHHFADLVAVYNDHQQTHNWSLFKKGAMVPAGEKKDAWKMQYFYYCICTCIYAFRQYYIRLHIYPSMSWIFMLGGKIVSPWFFCSLGVPDNISIIIHATPTWYWSVALGHVRVLKHQGFLNHVIGAIRNKQAINTWEVLVQQQTNTLRKGICHRMASTDGYPNPTPMQDTPPAPEGSL